MKSCKNCGKYPFCPNINENGCTEWVKQKYQEIERKEEK